MNNCYLKEILRINCKVDKKKKLESSWKNFHCSGVYQKQKPRMAVYGLLMSFFLEFELYKTIAMIMLNNVII